MPHKFVVLAGRLSCRLLAVLGAMPRGSGSCGVAQDHWRRSLDAVLMRAVHDGPRATDPAQ